MSASSSTMFRTTIGANLAAIDDIGSNLDVTPLGVDICRQHSLPVTAGRGRTPRGGVVVPFMYLAQGYSGARRPCARSTHTSSTWFDRPPTRSGLSPPHGSEGSHKSPLEGVSLAHTFNEHQSADNGFAHPILRNAGTPLPLTTK